MRKYVIKGLEICNGFLLLSALYCCVMPVSYTHLTLPTILLV